MRSGSGEEVRVRRGCSRAPQVWSSLQLDFRLGQQRLQGGVLGHVSEVDRVNISVQAPERTRTRRSVALREATVAADKRPTP